jgi:hypothetical protein
VVAWHSRGGVRVLPGRGAGGLAGAVHRTRNRLALRGPAPRRADRGAGFCTFNGLALAAHAAREARAGAVLILDLDAHFGGGTFSIVSRWKHVWHADVSVSSVDEYDPQGHPRATVKFVRDGATYLDVVRRVLDRLSGTSFDLLIYNAGMDPFERCDVGGLLGITKEVLDQREQLVFDWARDRRLPVAFVLAGGYTGARVSRADLVQLHMLTINAANPGRPRLVGPGRLQETCLLGDAWRAWIPEPAQARVAGKSAALQRAREGRAKRTCPRRRVGTRATRCAVPPADHRGRRRRGLAVRARIALARTRSSTSKATACAWTGSAGRSTGPGDPGRRSWPSSTARALPTGGTAGARSGSAARTTGQSSSRSRRA